MSARPLPPGYSQAFQVKMFERLLTCLACICFLTLPVFHLGCSSDRHRDFAQAKRVMEEQVIYDHRLTVYCGASFGEDKAASAPVGFEARGRHELRMNWEHALPVAAFGPSFEEWHHPPIECKRKGKKISRRQCAEMTNPAFRRMAGDMYNLFPALTPVNAARSNREFAELPQARTQFGSCGVKWTRGKFEPPDRAKGQLARAVLYMADAYPDRYRLKPAQQELMDAWDRSFPVDKWECQRARRIEKLQGNENRFIKRPCKRAGLW